jgi:catechol 2,3-dioxygenase-like lactoylglutathione lyase family enzyme
MGSSVHNITFDCADPERLAAWWAEALGYEEDPRYPNRPGDEEWLLVDPRRLHPGLLFIRVPEAKATKNRVHLDLTAPTTRDEEVARLLALGATQVADHRRPDGGGWVVLADPEGNELCIERSLAEQGRGPGPATGERPYPATRTTDELTGLVEMLDWYRVGVEAKVAGLDDHLATARPLPSPTSIAGLVKHLALVEDSWFHIRFAGLPEPADWAEADFDVDPDWEFHTALDEPLADQVTRYRAACERSRAAIVGHDLDDRAVAPGRGGPFNLRFALTHMLEETARHLGHLDVLRELLDGATGE